MAKEKREPRKTSMEIALTNLERELELLGALPEGEHLIYEKGSTINGVSRMLWQGNKGSLCPFVPRWSLNTTHREALAQVQAVAYALFTLRLNAEEYK